MCLKTNAVNRFDSGWRRGSGWWRRWAVALGDGQPELVALRRERQRQMLSLFAHPRKMRRRCLDDLQMPAESETSRSEEEDASEGDEANDFQIRRGNDHQPVRSALVLSFSCLYPLLAALCMHCMSQI